MSRQWSERHWRTRPRLVPYAGPFDGFHAVPASVSKTCLVRFDRNRYSVDARAVGRPVEIRAYADRIEIRQDGQVIGRHDRVFGRDHAVYDPLHYLPVLARKPGALRSEPSRRHGFETDGERPLQGLGSAASDAPDPPQARACPGRRSSDGGDTGRAADRRGRGGRGRLRRGAWPGRPLRRCRPQHSRPTSRRRRACGTTIPSRPRRLPPRTR